MTNDELQAAREARREQMRPAEPTPEEMERWVREVGFASLADLDEAFGDAREELLQPELANGKLLELWLWPDGLRYCAAELVEYVYVCVRPEQRTRRMSPLAGEVLAALKAADEPLTAAQARDALGAGRTSALSIERACHDLARRFLAVHAGGAAGGERRWTPTVRRFRELYRAPDRISQVESAGLFLTQYLDWQVCETEEACAAHFSPLLPRTRIHTALLGLEAARQIEPDQLEGRPAWRLRSTR